MIGLKVSHKSIHCRNIFNGTRMISVLIINFPILTWIWKSNDSCPLRHRGPRRQNWTQRWLTHTLQLINDNSSLKSLKLKKIFTIHVYQIWKTFGIPLRVLGWIWSQRLLLYCIALKMPGPRSKTHSGGLILPVFYWRHWISYFIKFNFKVNAFLKICYFVWFIKLSAKYMGRLNL